MNILSDKNFEAQKHGSTVGFVERCFGANHTFSPMVGEGGTECRMRGKFFNLHNNSSAHKNTPLTRICKLTSFVNKFRPLPQGARGDGSVPSPREREHASFAKQTDMNLSLFTSHFSREGKRVAFTLAEVLITLGIIGVVAAVTLSSVITKIQDRQNIVKWKKEYSVINNAFQAVVNDDIQVCVDYTTNGTCLDDGAGSLVYFSVDFINAMKEKLKVADTCGVGSAHIHLMGNKTWCRIYSYKPLGGEHVSVYNYCNWGFLLNDGTSVYFGGTHGGPWIVVDVNNATKGPNEFGRDTFVIKVFSTVNTATRQNQNKHIIKPMGAEGTYNKSKNGDICECSKDKGVKTANYIAGQGGTGEVISGACCSYKYLIE